MSAEAMADPVGEVLLDGRIMRMDGQSSGTYAAGEVVRGVLNDSAPPQMMVPDGTVLRYDSDDPALTIVEYQGAPPLIVGRPPVADVFWFETFMERLMRDVERRESKAS